MKKTTYSRIEVIDSLRGFALLGIIITHCANQYLAGPTPPSAGTLNLFSQFDTILGQVLGYLTFGKFFTIFSFLFGLSFAIQMDSASQMGRSFVGRTLWRLAILFFIGFIHSMFYSGDILRIYAFLGFFLILFRNANNRILVIVGLLLVFNAPLFINRLSSQFAPPHTKEQIEAEKAGGQAFMKMAEKGYKIKQSGSLAEVVDMNFKGGLMGTLSFQIFTGRLFITLGLFLLGLWAGRKKLFVDNPKNRNFFNDLFRWSLIIALISTLPIILMGGISIMESLKGWMGFIKATLADVHQISLSAFYLSGITILFWKSKSIFLQNLVPVGRMGLTTYLMGTAFGVITFLGYGFGQLGHLGLTVSVGLGILFFTLQIPFSKWWLSKFHFGPVEWLWRSLTYLKVQVWDKNEKEKLSY
jgi:uncharacterized protein